MKQRLNIFPNLLLVVLCDYGEYVETLDGNDTTIIILKCQIQMGGLANPIIP